MVALPKGPPCPPQYREAFEGEPRYAPVHAGERLYKFVSLPIDRERILQSPWWITEQTFDVLQAKARGGSTPMSVFVRIGLAIVREWNPGMDYVVTIVLGNTVPAWQGAARRQYVARGSSMWFKGASPQVCAPEIGWRDIAVQRMGTLKHA